MSVPRGIITLSSKAHSHSGQSVLSTHNLNRQDFVEQGDAAKEKGAIIKEGLGYKWYPYLLLLSSQIPVKGAKESRGPQLMFLM